MVPIPLIDYESSCGYDCSYQRFAHEDNLDLRCWFTFLQSEGESPSLALEAAPPAAPGGGGAVPPAGRRARTRHLQTGGVVSREHLL